MDPADNLNLIQPVNPWMKGGFFSSGSWNMYTEYFQWSPTDNSNSKSNKVNPGQHLHGSLVYDKATDSYDLTQEIVETGVKSTQNVKCQSGKKFTVPYVVYEKSWPCKSYPTDGIVTFTDIKVECDGTDCSDKMQWAAKVNTTCHSTPRHTCISNFSSYLFKHRRIKPLVRSPLRRENSGIVSF